VVDSVVGAKVVERDVIVGIETSCANRIEDLGNRAKLTSEDSECTTSSLLVQVSSESGNSRDQDDTLKPFVALCGGDDPVDECETDCVLYGSLLGAGSGDEELIFDVDAVIGFHDELSISVLNRMLFQGSVTPVCTTSSDLHFDSTSRLVVSFRRVEQVVSESVADFCECFEVRVTSDGRGRLLIRIDDVRESESWTAIIVTIFEVLDEIPCQKSSLSKNQYDAFNSRDNVESHLSTKC